MILFIALVGAVNLAFFVYWYSVSEVTAIMPVSPTGYTVEALALNVTILEMILVLVGFILAALGLFGYTEIKNAAVRAAVEAAEKEARETTSEQIKLYQQTISKAQGEAPEHSGNYGLGDQPIEGATPAQDE
ncbi:hypothetical protein HKX64_13375 [Sulfitobacter sp. M72]|uniref:hypothetical protein n=1 Tax=unclassified Sulfitobacter TaxID=196795 RepID=UPI0023E15CE8|nr:MULTISPECIES: hypothetical protein [unclassified Sulfitobacter]MDF3433997.1 hypothetical protein [Sulfitobacter sp. KE42]MDF3545312.1 hypothetical protein [Sulfitobacter sp. M72]